jgi:hypothetical protein
LDWDLAGFGSAQNLVDDFGGRPYSLAEIEAVSYEAAFLSELDNVGDGWESVLQGEVHHGLSVSGQRSSISARIRSAPY